MRFRSLLLAGAAMFSACTARVGASTGETFVLASTTSTQDSGLLDHITAEFEESHRDMRVKVVAVGSGEAMDLGRSGDADVLLVHSPREEEEFMQAGYGVFRLPVMRNDFVIAGSPQDPAHLGGLADAVEAFSRIARAQAPFVSRGDNSGTHTRELQTWKASGVNPKASWYVETGQGMGETLIVASEKRAYVLTDTASLTVGRGAGDIAVLVTRDARLINPYSVIPVASSRHPGPAREFAEWITGPEGQDEIAEFGRAEYGAPLFTPTAK
ncbi:MAG: substrate-binding domain-containing protein [Actinomycetota bacterium]